MASVLSRVPKQLRNAPRHRRRRPLFEDLHFLDIRRLGREGMFPADWHSSNIYSDVGFIFPGIKALAISRSNIRVLFYGGREQIIPIRWYRPGLGGRRPASKCSCGKGTFRFYITGNRLACYRCTHAIYASRARNSDTRPFIQLRRIKAYLASATGLHSRTKHRLRATQLALQARLPARYVWHSKRIPDRALRPRQRYRHHGSMDIT